MIYDYMGPGYFRLIIFECFDNNFKVLNNQKTSLTGVIRGFLAIKRKVSIKEKFFFTSQSNYILYMIYTKLVMNSKSVYKFTK